ncbi:nuclear localization sequence binding protein [Didymella pomorum]|uniref:Nuclear localization sequence binding protein n=1 Tax=Didymella pomorum TaxID=749634 RepID=A0A9W8ZCJ9_9PLEO|nr:nuclear localization sequence binding protein [Didymella pomorum]
MGKTKVADKKEKKSESVKAGRVTKATETPKAKSKAVAKSAGKAVEKEVKKSSKKAKKEPTPEPSSSESDSESEAESSDSDSEIPDAPAAKAESSDSDSSDSDSESEEEKPAAKTNGAKAAPKAAAKAESSDSSDSDSDSDNESEEKPAAKAASSDSDSGSDSDADSDDSSDSSDSDEEAPSKKRKAEEATEPAVKKSKTEEAPAAAEGIKNLFVGSLSWNVDEDWLRREFESFGNIIGCRVISDRETGRSKGFGYVEFDDAGAAAKAQKEMMGYELDGRALNVDFSTPREKPANKTFDRANKFGDKRSAPSNTLFLGNLSFDCSNEVVQEAFQEYGNISRVSLPTDRETGALKGFGYVDFSSTEEASAALEALNGAEIAGRPIRLDFAAARDDSNGGGRGGFGGGRGGGRGGRGGFGDRGGRGGGRGGRGGFGDRGGRGGRGGARGGSFNRGGFGDFKGSKVSFD